MKKDQAVDDMKCLCRSLWRAAAGWDRKYLQFNPLSQHSSPCNGSELHKCAIRQACSYAWASLIGTMAHAGPAVLDPNPILASTDRLCLAVQGHVNGGGEAQRGISGWERTADWPGQEESGINPCHSITPFSAGPALHQASLICASYIAVWIQGASLGKWKYSVSFTFRRPLPCL